MDNRLTPAYKAHVDFTLNYLLNQIQILASTTPEGLGTTGYIPKWGTPTTQTDSQIFDNGTSIGIKNINPQATLDISGTLAAGNGTVNFYRNGVNVWATQSVPVFDYRYLVVNSGGSTFTTDKISLFNRTLNNGECVSLTT